MNRDEKKCPGFRNVRDRRDLMLGVSMGDLLSMNRPCIKDDEDGTEAVYLNCENTRSLRKVGFFFYSNSECYNGMKANPTDPEMVGKEVAHVQNDQPSREHHDGICPCGDPSGLLSSSM